MDFVCDRRERVDAARLRFVYALAGQFAQKAEVIGKLTRETEGRLPARLAPL